MGIFTSGCCCFDSLKEAAKASSIFTGVTSVVNIIINIWCLVTLHHLLDYLEPNEEWNYIPPGFLGLLYIELVFNLCLFGLAFVLAIGINRGFEGKKWMMTWMWGFGIFRMYEVLFGIYLLVWLSAHRIPDILFLCPQFLFVVAYWGINSFILVFAMLGVWSYWDEVFDDIYGKEKRVKYFSMLANIRAAGISKSQNYLAGISGAATPRSLFMSRETLGTGYSQPSVSVSSYPTKQPRSHLPSTTSQVSYHSVAAGPPRGPPQPGYPPPQGYPPQPGYPPQGAPQYPPQGGGGRGGPRAPPPSYPQGGMPRLPEEGYRAGQRLV